MRFAAVLLVTLTVGCGQPAGPQLQFVDFSADGTVNPMPLALKIANDGGDVEIDAIEVEIVKDAVLAGPDGAAALDSFRPVVALMVPTSHGGTVGLLAEGKSITLSAGSTADVWALLLWELPKSPPPLVAIASATFTLKRKGEIVFTTPPYAFTLQSRRRVLDAVLRRAGDDLERSGETLEVVRSLAGQQSAGMIMLRARLESLLAPTD